MAFLLSRIGLVRPRSEMIKIKSNQISATKPSMTQRHVIWLGLSSYKENCHNIPAPKANASTFRAFCRSRVTNAIHTAHGKT
jgi:hypothetical protein